MVSSYNGSHNFVEKIRENTTEIPNTRSNVHSGISSKKTHESSYRAFESSQTQKAVAGPSDGLENDFYDFSPLFINLLKKIQTKNEDNQFDEDYYFSRIFTLNDKVKKLASFMEFIPNPSSRHVERKGIVDLRSLIVLDNFKSQSLYIIAFILPSFNPNENENDAKLLFILMLNYGKLSKSSIYSYLYGSYLRRKNKLKSSLKRVKNFHSTEKSDLESQKQTSSCSYERSMAHDSKKPEYTSVNGPDQTPDRNFAHATAIYNPQLPQSTSHIASENTSQIHEGGSFSPEDQVNYLNQQTRSVNFTHQSHPHPSGGENYGINQSTSTNSIPISALDLSVKYEPQSWHQSPEQMQSYAHEHAQSPSYHTDVQIQNAHYWSNSESYQNSENTTHQTQTHYDQRQYPDSTHDFHDYRKQSEPAVSNYYETHDRYNSYQEGHPHLTVNQETNPSHQYDAFNGQHFSNNEHFRSEAYQKSPTYANQIERTDSYQGQVNFGSYSQRYNDQIESGQTIPAHLLSNSPDTSNWHSSQYFYEQHQLPRSSGETQHSTPVINNGNMKTDSFQVVDQDQQPQGQHTGHPGQSGMYSDPEMTYQDSFFRYNERNFSDFFFYILQNILQIENDSERKEEFVSSYKNISLSWDLVFDIVCKQPTQSGTHQIPILSLIVFPSKYCKSYKNTYYFAEYPKLKRNFLPERIILNSEAQTGIFSILFRLEYKNEFYELVSGLGYTYIGRRQTTLIISRYLGSYSNLVLNQSYCYEKIVSIYHPVLRNIKYLLFVRKK